MLSYQTSDFSRFPSAVRCHQNRVIEEKLLQKAIGSCVLYQGPVASMPQCTHDDAFKVKTFKPYKPEPRNIEKHREKEVHSSHKRNHSNSLLDLITEDYNNHSYPKAKQLKTASQEIQSMHFDPYSMPEEDIHTLILNEREKDFVGITNDKDDDSSQSSDCTSVATLQSSIFKSASNEAIDATDQTKFVSRSSSPMSESEDCFPEDYIHDFDVELDFSSNCPHFQTGLSERQQKEDKPARPTNFLLSLINRVLEQPDGVSLSIAGDAHYKNFDERLNHLFTRKIDPILIDKLASPLDESHGLVQGGSENDASNFQPDGTHDFHDADASMIHDIKWKIEGKGYDADLDSISRRVHSIANNLDEAMKKSIQSMSLLQEWDKKNGLPKSHSQTMVNSSRSREQLMTGMILQKWNGRPLLSLPGAKVKIVRKAFRGIPVADSFSQ